LDRYSKNHTGGYELDEFVIFFGRKKNMVDDDIFQILVPKRPLKQCRTCKKGRSLRPI
jgi:hypothetical protein